MYAVEVKCTTDEWTHHSDHKSYKSAVDQSDMVHGRVIVAETGCLDTTAFSHAKLHQGFTGSFSDWRLLEDSERDEYEIGANC